MVNYELVKAEKQLVAGVNIRLTFKGLDKYSRVTVIVGFDLDDKSWMLAFMIGCEDGVDQPCNSVMVVDYFKSTEAVVVSHP